MAPTDDDERRARAREAEDFDPAASTLGVLLELAHGADDEAAAAAARRLLERLFQELAGG